MKTKREGVLLLVQAKGTAKRHISIKPLYISLKQCKISNTQPCYNRPYIFIAWFIHYFQWCYLVQCFKNPTGRFNRLYLKLTVWLFSGSIPVSFGFKQFKAVEPWTMNHDSEVLLVWCLIRFLKHWCN